MIFKEYEGLKWLEFELLAEAPIVHGCFTRQGGRSTGLFDSLNLGSSVGDNPDCIRDNFKKVAEALSLKAMGISRICHRADVSEIKAFTYKEMPTSDGLMTSLKNFAIVVTQADCQAAIFYDPVNHAMANVHCGWRSSVLDIYSATVNAMKKTYGTHAEDLLVAISPSLGPENAEFINYRKELPEEFWQFRIKECHFDLWALSEWQLRKSGILPHHIQIARIDTYESPDYFSYRQAIHCHFQPCGRQATIASLI